DHDGVFQRAGIGQGLDDLRHGRALLADGDIDAIKLGLLIGAGVDGLLVDDGVDGDGGLAGLAVADDQFALAAADRDQSVDGFQAGLHRFMHRLARDDARRLDVDAAAFGGALDLALAVNGIAQRVNHAAQKRLAHRHFHDGAGALDGVAFLDGAVVAENHAADIVGFEIERHALDAAGKLDHLAGLDIVEAVHAGDAVADAEHFADFTDLRLGAEILDLALQDGGDFGGLDIHIRFLHSKLACPRL